MSDWQKVRREGVTERKVRDMDAAEIVEWVHGLEDRIGRLEECKQEMSRVIEPFIANFATIGELPEECEEAEAVLLEYAND